MKMLDHGHPLLAALVTLCPIPALLSAQGQHSPRMSLRQMASDAELIFVGVAAAAESRWNDAHTTIRTFVRFDNVAVHKGHVNDAAKAAPLVLRFDGGQVGDTRIEVSGMPRPILGRRYLILVRGNGRHASPIVGYDQGIFEIQRVAGRDSLRTLSGYELCDLRDGRPVFVPKRSPRTAPRPMPTLGDTKSELVLAHPQAARLEAQQRAKTASRLIELPARVETAAPAGMRAKTATADQAAPPPLGPRVDLAAKSQDGGDATTPIYLTSDSDDGRRIDLKVVVSTLLQLSR